MKHLLLAAIAAVPAVSGAPYAPVDTLTPLAFPNSGKSCVAKPADNLNNCLSSLGEGDTLVLQGAFTSALKVYGTGNGGKLGHDINVDATGATLSGATLTGGLKSGAPLAINWKGGVFSTGTLAITGQSASAAMPTQIHGVRCDFQGGDASTCISLQKTAFVQVYDVDIHGQGGDGIDCGSCTNVEVWHSREIASAAGKSHPDFFQAWEIAGLDHVHDINVHDVSIIGLTQGVDDFDGMQDPKYNVSIHRVAYAGPAQWAAGSWGGCTNCALTDNEAFADSFPEPWEYGGPWQSGFYMSGANVTNSGNVSGAAQAINSSNTHVPVPASSTDATREPTTPVAATPAPTTTGR